MNKNTHNSPVALMAFLLVAGALTFTACVDPVGDAPRATVAPAKADTLAKAADPTASSPVPAGTTRYTFSQDGGQDGAMVTFVAAKVTKKHDGGFKKIKGIIDVTGDQATVEAEIDIGSVFTDAPKLTSHLLSADLLDVAQFPTARFKSTSITKDAAGKTTIRGEFTLHGVTKVISFPATVTTSSDAASAKAEFGINRKDFGIVYPGSPDDLIHDDVLLKLDVSAKRAGPRT